MLSDNICRWLWSDSCHSVYWWQKSIKINIIKIAEIELASYTYSILIFDDKITLLRKISKIFFV